MWIILVLLGCSGAQQSVRAGSGEKPEWIDNPNRRYPDAMYLVGLGIGDTRKDAENSAIAGISTIFQARVSVNRDLVERYQETSTSDAEFESEMKRRIAVTSNQELRNIQFRENYFAKDEARHYVLAVLPRLETAELYKTEIQKGEAQIGGFYANAQRSTDKLTRYALLSRAIDLAEINEVLNGQLRLISRIDETTAPGISKSDMMAERREVINGLTVQLKPQAEADAAVGDYIGAVISKIGMQVVAGESDFVVDYQLAMEEAQINRPGQTGYDWELQLSLIDRVKDASVYSYSKGNRSVSISAQQAKRLILRKVKAIVEGDFARSLEAYMRQL